MYDTQQGYGPATGPEAEEQIFKEKFGEMAFSALSAKFAELMPNVITFKIIDIDVTAGSGVGVFIVNLDNKPIYIPVILVDSRLKPIEIVYYKELNMFLPLDMSWLDEINKMSLGEMGEGATIPPSVSRDVDITDIVLPPQVNAGRYGYASWEEDADKLFKEAEVQEYILQKDLFLKTMERAPRQALDGIKLAFETNPEMFNTLASNYGIDSIVSAMNTGYNNSAQTVKIAETKPGTVRILTNENTADEISKVFGTEKAAAYERIMTNGYAVKDTRNHIEKVAVKLEKPVFLDAPGPNSCWYKLFFSDGKPGNYFVIPHPIRDNHKCHLRIDDPYGCSETKREPIPYLVISEDLKEVWKTQDIIGEPILDPENTVGSSALYKLLNTEITKKPKVNSRGVFINVLNKDNVECTDLETIEQVISDGAYTKYCSCLGPNYVIDIDPSRKCIQYVRQNDTYYLPKNVKFIPAYKYTDKNKYDKQDKYNKRRKNSIIDDPKVLMRWVNNILQDAGVEQPKVKTAGLNQFWVNSIDTPISRHSALEKIATDYHVSINDANAILDNACTLGKATIYIVNNDDLGHIKEAFNKYAQPTTEQPMTYQSTPGQTAGLPAVDNAAVPTSGMEMPMGPGGMPLDPMQAAMVPQASVTPTDLAIGEAVDGLQQQIAMQQQQAEAQMANLEQQTAIQTQANQQLVETLQGIQDRSKQIMQATGGAIPPQAMESPAVAAGELAPAPPMETPPPPMPIMQQENISPEMVAQQINPEMIEQAQGLNDSGVFDTAAISMLASAPVLQDIVSTYVPNLEKAVDNLGRILLTLWLKEGETKENIGDEAFTSLEDQLRTVFKGLGEVILTLSHNAMNSPQNVTNSRMLMQGQ